MIIRPRLSLLYDRLLSLRDLGHLKVANPQPVERFARALTRTHRRPSPDRPLTRRPQSYLIAMHEREDDHDTPDR